MRLCPLQLSQRNLVRSNVELHARFLHQSSPSSTSAVYRPSSSFQLFVSIPQPIAHSYTYSFVYSFTYPYSYSHHYQWLRRVPLSL